MGLEVSHFRGAHAPVIIASGTCNAYACSPYRTWAYRRAEVPAFVGSPFRLPSGNMLTFGRVRLIDPQQYGNERLCHLTHLALKSIGPLLAKIPKRARIAVALCLPTRARRDERLRTMMESVVLGPFVEFGFDVMARTLPLGHASFAYGARDVGSMIQEGKVDLALTLGVDSYYDPFVLEELFEEQRVLDAEWREGFVPGEAATALLLASKDTARDLGAPILGHLEAAATHDEPARRDNSEGMLGHGLSRPAVAIARRLKEQGRHVDWWISDATAEPLRIQELSMAWPRASHLAMTPEGVIDLLPTTFGDLGAATLPTGVMLAIEGLRRGDPAGSTCLLTGSSDDGERGVVLLRAEPASSPRPPR